ncbi:apolipoprotein N-acyltransferase [Nocardioides sp. AX2bis]|uniref:apolipoprotein N-acyltransferase n=1 Tax=Nocardioides sp. AX2bis TaxID=2653157 RepID=UPI0012F19EBA|nr:apolipoprotein N-acyltransferase [Nocardioides sp. AX2bis]VXB55909.1 Apolipoprotein N-acyltransferase [Nocardioides sp. AX2bis]
MLVRLLVALVSGGLLATSFEPLTWWWVTPFCVAGLALSVAGLRPGRAWWPALVFAVAFYFPHIVWMRAVSTGAWLALAGIEAVFYAALGPVLVVLMRHRAWPLWGAGAWALAETVRSSWPFSGMPWGRLGFGVMDTPVAPALGYVGATGVGFGLALASFCLAAAVLTLHGGAGGSRRTARAGTRAVAGPLVTVVVLVALTGLAAAFPVRLAVTGQATVAAVQPDVPGAGNDILAGFREVTASTVQETVDLAADVEAGRVPRPDLVLWPENSTAVDPFADTVTNAGIRRASAAIGVPVVVGGIVDGGPGEVLNQGLVWEQGDRTAEDVTERYTKRHPVPYGEYIPARDLLEDLGVPIGNFGDLALIPRDMVAGERTTPLQVAGIAMADAICFDVGYDDVLHDQVLGGAELLAVQTSNATFIATDQVDQQFAITRARAVEAGRWLVVASTNGITAVVAPDGSVVAEVPRRATATLLEQVDLVEGVTPGVRVGRYAGWGALGLTAAGLALGLAAGRRRVPGTMEEHDPTSPAPPHPS